MRKEFKLTIAMLCLAAGLMGCGGTDEETYLEDVPDPIEFFTEAFGKENVDFEPYDNHDDIKGIYVDILDPDMDQVMAAYQEYTSLCEETGVWVECLADYETSWCFETGDRKRRLGVNLQNDGCCIDVFVRTFK